MTTDAPPTTIAAFLIERYRDEEIEARLAAEAAPSPWEAADRGWMASLYCAGSDERMLVLDQDAVPGRKTPGDVLVFVARHDPARVLAECAANRRIVELHAGNGATCSTCGDGHDDYGDLYQPFPCDTLKALALPYATHPDFRPEWTA